MTRLDNPLGAWAGSGGTSFPGKHGSRPALGTRDRTSGEYLNVIEIDTTTRQLPKDLKFRIATSTSTRDRALHEPAQQLNFSCTAMCRGVGHDPAARLTLTLSD